MDLLLRNPTITTPNLPVSLRTHPQSPQLTPRSDDKVAADHLVTQLQSIHLPDSDISPLISFLTIEHQIRQGNYSQALETVEKAAQTMHQDNFDIHFQVKLLCLKARILEKTDQPQRGFSLAMRAASIAHGSRLLPGLWEAICVLGGVLLSLGEFEAVSELVESIMPRVLETDDCDLAARAYSLLVDANMGIAGAMWSQGQGEYACAEGVCESRARVY